MGVSQRHLSFVESGRAKPSRALLLAWLQALDAPLALQNQALLQAGFAPAFDDSPLAAQHLAPVRQALTRLLAAHNPMPAMVMNAQWDVLELNTAALWLAQTLMPGFMAQHALDTPQAPLNMIDALAHPLGLGKQLVNRAEVTPAVLAHMRADAGNDATMLAKIEAVAKNLETGAQSKAQLQAPASPAPVLTSRFASPHGELAFFSMFSTFGTPQNISLQSLRVEHLFAANMATDAVMRRVAAPPS